MRSLEFMMAVIFHQWRGDVRECGFVPETFTCGVVVASAICANVQICFHVCVRVSPVFVWITVYVWKKAPRAARTRVHHTCARNHRSLVRAKSNMSAAIS